MNPNARYINAAAQIDDSESVFTFYRRLIDLRHTEPVISHGDFALLIPEDENIYAFVRSFQGVDFLVMGNFSGSEVAADLADPTWAFAEQVMGNYAPASSLAMRPWELKVLRRGILGVQGVLETAYPLKRQRRPRFRHPLL